MSTLSTTTAKLQFALLTFLLATSSPLHSQPLFTKTTICAALAHPARFDGKRVKIHAKYAGTFEGTWLSEDGCVGVGELLLPSDHSLAMLYGVEETVAKQSKRYGTDDVIRDRAWQQFDFSRRHLYTGMTIPTEGCCEYVTADFSGFLIIKRNFRVKDGFGNGWGHLGASRFLLVLHSVSDVSSQPCAGISNAAPPN